ncbi:uncharacterized protein LOC144562633 isoform X1 [Carex rostrata]
MSTVDNNHTAISRDAPATIAPEPQDVVAADRKATEKLILDSKEKIEYYRTIMQELVLYKSHCDTMRDSNPRDVCKLFYVDFWRRLEAPGKDIIFFIMAKPLAAFRKRRESQTSGGTCPSAGKKGCKRRERLLPTLVLPALVQAPGNIFSGVS